MFICSFQQLNIDNYLTLQVYSINGRNNIIIDIIISVALSVLVLWSRDLRRTALNSYYGMRRWFDPRSESRGIWVGSDL